MLGLLLLGLALGRVRLLLAGLGGVLLGGGLLLRLLLAVLLWWRRTGAGWWVVRHAVVARRMGVWRSLFLSCARACALRLLLSGFASRAR